MGQGYGTSLEFILFSGLSRMANSIGAKIRSGFVAVLVGLLVLAFAVWGVNDIFVPGVRNAVISVGDESVSTRTFDRDMRAQLRTIAEQRGEGLTNEEAYRQGIHRQLIQNYQTQSVIAKDADDLGVGVNRADARREIESNPAFQSSITGEFDRAKLDSLLAFRRDYTIQQYEEDVLRDLRRTQSVDAIVSGIQAPTGYAKRFFDFVQEQRSGTALVLNAEAVDTPPAPTDAQLQSYISANAVRYTAPEYRQVTMIRLEPSGLAQDIQVTEEQVKEEFEFRIAKGELGSAETRDIVVLSAGDEAKAIEAAERLAKGEEPDLVAAALGLVSPDRFDGVTADQLLDPQTDETAFALKAGEAKAAENSFGGWEAVYAAAVTPAQTPSFSALEPELRRAIALDGAKSRINDLQGDIETGLTEGQSLEDIAKSLDLPMESYDFIDRVGQTQDGLRLTGSTRIPGIAADDNLLREIFTADIGFDGDPIQTTGEGLAVFRVTDVIDSVIRPLEDIRDDVTLAWTNEQIDTALIAKGVELEAQLRDGKTLEALAEDLGEAAELRDIILPRANPPRDLSNSVIVELLNGEPGKIARGDGAQPQTYVIGRLDQIVPNSDGFAGEMLETLQERISSEISSDIQSAYQQAVLREHELREYPDQVRAVLGIDAPN
jgi:peptidyl-prolyl cis-trans isomerase D